MPRRVKIRWNLPAFEEIRRTPEINAILQEHVERIVAATGHPEDYASGVEPGKTRSRGYIVTKTFAGIRREHKEHTLLRVLGGESS